jgi:hypothetical protein
MKQEQSHKETSKVSGDSATQNSLEKGLAEIPNDRGDRFSRAINVALADQKQKIKEWLIMNRQGIVDVNIFESWIRLFDKDFEDLKP